MVKREKDRSFVLVYVKLSRWTGIIMQKLLYFTMFILFPLFFLRQSIYIVNLYSTISLSSTIYIRNCIYRFLSWTAKSLSLVQVSSEINTVSKRIVWAKNIIHLSWLFPKAIFRNGIFYHYYLCSYLPQWIIYKLFDFYCHVFVLWTNVKFRRQTLTPCEP